MPSQSYERVRSVDDLGVSGPDPEERVQIVTTASETAGTTKRDLLHNTLITFSVIACYFVLSIALTFYNRALFVKFQFPLCVTSYHLMVKFLLSAIVRLLYRCKTGQARILLDWRTSLLKMGPPGFVSGIDIGFSSWGLELVTISLYTMTKSTTIIFILMFAILLGLERKSWSLLLIVVLISGGLVMFNYKSTQFEAFGFSLVLFASFASGIRWSLAQLIMQKSRLGLHNPVDMTFHMQPWMMLSIIPLAAFIEGSRVLQNAHSVFEMDANSFIVWTVKLSVGACMAFMMELAEFLTLSYTSSLTLSVVGIFKEICQLFLAFEFQNDSISRINMLGLVLCLGGIVCHVVTKYLKYVQEHGEEQSSVSYQTYTRRSLGLKKGGPNQRAPLLESDTLDFSTSEESDSQENGSNVIFDVLKRRDARR